MRVSAPLARDQERLAAIRGGDEAAFEAVFREHYGRLCVYASRMISSPETAEEIVQAALLFLWQQRHDIELTGTLSGYLYGIVRNRARMHLRREGVERRWRERVLAGGSIALAGAAPAQADEHIREAQIAEAIRQAIDQLPPRCREAFLLRTDRNLSYAEIARTMGISPKTVEVQIGAALRSLRSLLAEWWTD